MSQQPKGPVITTGPLFLHRAGRFIHDVHWSGHQTIRCRYVRYRRNCRAIHRRSLRCCVRHHYIHHRRYSRRCSGCSRHRSHHDCSCRCWPHDHSRRSCGFQSFPNCRRPTAGATGWRSAGSRCSGPCPSCRRSGHSSTVTSTDENSRRREALGRSDAARWLWSSTHQTVRRRNATGLWIRSFRDYRSSRLSCCPGSRCQGLGAARCASSSSCSADRPGCSCLMTSLAYRWARDWPPSIRSAEAAAHSGRSRFLTVVVHCWPSTDQHSFQRCLPAIPHFALRS